MEDKIIYTYILIKTDGTYLGWSKAKTEKTAGDGMKWVEWNKSLPEDIDSMQYKYKNKTLVKKG